MVTAWVVLTVTAAFEASKLCQFPEYVPPCVITIGGPKGSTVNCPTVIVEPFAKVARSKPVVALAGMAAVMLVSLAVVIVIAWPPTVSDVMLLSPVPAKVIDWPYAAWVGEYEVTEAFDAGTDVAVPPPPPPHALKQALATNAARMERRFIFSPK